MVTRSSTWRCSALVVFSLLPWSTLAASVASAECRKLLGDMIRELKVVVQSTGKMLSLDKRFEMALVAKFSQQVAPEVKEERPIKENGAMLREGGAELTAAIGEVTALGGQIQTGPKSQFFVRKDGTPVIQISDLTHLRHELDHFHFWREFRAGLVDSQGPEEASHLAYAALLTPLGNLHVETRAALIELKALAAKPELSDVDIDNAVWKRNYPYLSALVSGIELRDNAQKFEDTEKALKVIVEDTNRVLKLFLKHFDERHAQAHEHYAANVRRANAETTKAEFLAWASNPENLKTRSWESMTPALRAQLLQIEHSPAMRDNRLQNISDRVGAEKYGQALYDLILAGGLSEPKPGEGKK